MSFSVRVSVACMLLVAVHAKAQLDPTLRPYTNCKFDDDLTLAELSPLPAGVAGRSVDTLTGTRQVPLLRGEHVTFSYPGTDFFATVKVEQLPAAGFLEGKKNLISNFDHILAGGDESVRNMAFALRPRLNGFETYGLDRKRMEGNVLGIYLLIDNRTHVVASVYFVNPDVARSKFSTMEGYAQLRDHFLNAYTSCVHAAHVVTPAARRAIRRSR